MDFDDSRGSFDSTIIKEKMAEVSWAMKPLQGLEAGLLLAIADTLMFDDEPVATEAQALPTVSDLLAEPEPAAELIREEPARPKPAQPATLPPTSEVPNPPEEMDRRDDQSVTTELAMANIDKPIPERLVEQRTSSSELAQETAKMSQV